MTYLWIAVAGSAGAVTRYGLDQLLSRRTPGGFPWGTLIVNVTGCLIAGFVANLFVQRVDNEQLRMAITVGFLGAYTTFSAFGVQTVRLVQDGSAGSAALYVAASVVLGLVAVFAGMRSASLLS